MKQPPAFGTALVISCQCMRQEINCHGEVFAAVSFSETGNSCESGTVLIHRLYEESAEFYREAMGLIGLAAIEAVKLPILLVSRCASARDALAVSTMELIAFLKSLGMGVGTCATLANASVRVVRRN